MMKKGNTVTVVTLEGLRAERTFAGQAAKPLHPGAIACTPIAAVTVIAERDFVVPRRASGDGAERWLKQERVL